MPKESKIERALMLLAEHIADLINRVDELEDEIRERKLSDKLISEMFNL